MVVIKAEHIAKKYIIRHEQAERYKTLSGTLSNLAKNVGQRSKEEFWALDDISFEINQGERVGIIGRNGAGKSTLLKVLSRIVTPTSGRVEITGRVASLLEVGTGFHPELSGRENIFLNGSILGMSRKEIQAKFDEIVDFAEVEKFLDTPVKRYSSGMYVRLAFAVAAHLEPDIFIVDEVLAVGDAAFQKKCLGKMNDVTGQGRTVLFVSHNMGQIKALCEKTIVLNKGKIIFNGDINEGVSVYYNKDGNQHEIYQAAFRPEKTMMIVKAFTAGKDKQTRKIFLHNEGEHLQLTVQHTSIPPDAKLGISVSDGLERKVFTKEVSFSQIAKSGSDHTDVTFTIPGNFLVPGIYKFNVGLHIPNMHMFDYQEGICEFSIMDNGSEFAQYANTDYGCVFPNAYFEVNP